MLQVRKHKIRAYKCNVYRIETWEKQPRNTFCTTVFIILPDKLFES